MPNDTVIRSNGMKILAKYLGVIEAERFIVLINRESFNYTEWQKDLYKDMTLKELGEKANEFRKSAKTLENI